MAGRIYCSRGRSFSPERSLVRAIPSEGARLLQAPDTGSLVQASHEVGATVSTWVRCGGDISLGWGEDVHDAEFYSKPESRGRDPIATSGSDQRVLRGGTWPSIAQHGRSAFRAGDAPST